MYLIDYYSVVNGVCCFYHWIIMCLSKKQKVYKLSGELKILWTLICDLWGVTLKGQFLHIYSSNRHESDLGRVHLDANLEPIFYKIQLWPQIYRDWTIWILTQTLGFRGSWVWNWNQFLFCFKKTIENILCNFYPCNKDFLITNFQMRRVYGEIISIGLI